ncbi:SpoIIE family protein phosphatase [Streptomyces sp. NPDC058595]|uniref:SpoIIE family protein phosphatase n=1 Tax=Streptomyces sp. NPDC058595 TaxID=3346550 RepID=UPI003647C873
MPSHLFADRPASQPPERGVVESLITRTRSLRGDVDAVRRDAVADEHDTHWRWQRALCDLAVHQLDDLGAHLGQLKNGLPDGGAESATVAAADAGDGTGSLLNRVGTAEWNLLTDGVVWSPELYEIFGRPPEKGPMTLDELPSVMVPEDQGLLQTLVTECLVDGKHIDGEFRVVRPDRRVRTLHMTGEPVLDSDGCTASMWAVLRDVSELRRSQRAVHECGDTLRRRERTARTEQRLVTELREAVLPSWRGSLRSPASEPGTLDLAGHCPPAGSGLVGGDWFDALKLPDGSTLLTVGDLTGNGVTAASTMAMLLGAQRGMAVAGVQPGALMGHLNQLLDTADQPALGSAVCCRYRPATRTLVWAQAGHPAPLLFRDGTGRALTELDGVLLGATSGAAYEQAETQLLPGDLLVLHTGGLTERTGVDRLLALGPRLTGTRDAQDCVRTIVEEFGGAGREDDACVLVAGVNETS